MLHGSKPQVIRKRLFAWLMVSAVASAVLYLPAMTSWAQEDEVLGEDGPSVAPVPRRPPRYRPDPPVSFPEPLLPGKSQRPPRDDPRALDAFLGPVPKEVVVREGSSLAEMQRIVAIPNTRLGFATAGGNTLTPEDVRRLSRMGAVSLYLEAPLEAIHVEVAERITSLRSVTVRVPPEGAPDETLSWRLSRLGFARRNVVFEGVADPAGIEAIAEPSAIRLTIRLPDDGFGPEVLALLESRPNLAVRVPPRANPVAIEGLAGLRIEALELETEGNRLRAEVLEAALALGSINTVLLDRRAGPEDLRRLKGIPRLRVVVWLAEAPGVPTSITDLLLESEGMRSGQRRSN